VKVAWLEKHFTALLREQDRRVEAIKWESDKALQVALTASERRLEGLNEFRSTVEDWSKNYAQSTAVEKMNEAQRQTNLRHEQAINRAYGAVVIIGLLGIVNTVRLYLGA
jgi:hypothetical protein